MQNRRSITMTTGSSTGTPPTVLNPALYTALLRAFGSVGVSHPGEPRECVYAPARGLNGLVLKSTVKQYGEQYQVNCPFCGDTRRRLNISYCYGVTDKKTRSPNRHLFHCFNEKCHQDRANWQQLYDRLDQAGYRPGQATISAPLANTSNSADSPIARPIALPARFIPLHLLDLEHAAVQYVVSRGFDPLELSAIWGVGYCHSDPDSIPPLEERLVIPIYSLRRSFGLPGEDSNQACPVLTGWQARALDKDTLPKYLTAQGFQKSSVLYGLPQALATRGPVYLCEGATDCWAIGPGAVALLGKTISPAQISLLERYFRPRPIVILLDRDACQDALEISAKLRGRLPHYAVVELPEGGDDPGECTREEILECAARALGVDLAEIATDKSALNAFTSGVCLKKDTARLESLGQIIAVQPHIAVIDGQPHLAAVALVGEDNQPVYVGRALKSGLKSLADRHVVYWDALLARQWEMFLGFADPRSFDDLRTAARLLDEKAVPELRDLARKCLPEISNSAPPAALPVTPPVHEALTDAWYIRQIAESGFLAKQLDEEGLTAVYSDIELPLIDVTATMMNAGILVDQDWLERQCTTWRAELESLATKAFKLTGNAIELDNDAEVAHYLFEEKKLPVFEYRDDGLPSVSDDRLELLANLNPLPQLVIWYRKIDRLLGEAQSLWDYVDSETGRVYCELDPLGTATGRFSARNPNLQAISRELRRAFVAPEGHVLLEADFSQIELRVLAELSRDPGLVKSYRRGEDLHRKTASLVLDKPLKEITATDRALGKKINFAIIYGQTDQGLAKELGISLLDAEEHIERFMDGYPGVRDWIAATKNRAREQGYVATMFGRRRRLPELASDDEQAVERALRQAVNAVIQGTAADLNKLALIRLYQALDDDCQMLLTVHDSVLLEVPEHRADEIAEQVGEIMVEQPEWFGVPLEVDGRAGGSWGMDAVL